MARTRSLGDGAPDGEQAGYTVVARRYRPQRFEDVVGQDHVVEALRNAIRLNRVTHAYLFSGTRGVGKTSIARIFAKCLNCQKGMTDEPDLTCDICQAIAAGQDVDVIEIDGASNNGVEAVRELRQNAGLRPSRARFKIYYIDEVHMLSTGAFNALLKTLEEPPAHVKFFFATTEPNKIPITVLSRCQRYDFAPIAPDLLVKTLAKICKSEGVEAESDALQVVARRAGGSMRDGESLLEQLLSGGGKKLTSESVHRSLGLAPDDRVLDLIDALGAHDVAAALKGLDEAIGSGVQPVELLNSALEFLRDVMMVAAKADVSTLAASPAQRPRLQAIAGRMSLDSVLASLQILAEARGRLRGSPHGRLIVELAFARVARLEDLSEMGDLIARLSALDGGSEGPPAKKRVAAPEPPPPPAPISNPLPPDPPEAVAPDDPAAIWNALPDRLGDPLRGQVKRLRAMSIEPPGVLVVQVPEGNNYVADACDKADARGRIEAALHAITGRSLTIRFDRVDVPRASTPSAPPPTSTLDLAADPLVRRVVELFEARPVHVESDDREHEGVG